MARRRKKALIAGEDLRVEAFVELWRAYEALSGAFRSSFKDAGLTAQQYNVLRILYVRDPDRQGLSCQEISDRLIHRLPDITRLLDRLEGAGWLYRERSTEDRRVVMSFLTDAGADKVEELHPQLMKVHHRILGHVGDSELRTLLRLLRKTQEGVSR